MKYLIKTMTYFIVYLLKQMYGRSKKLKQYDFLS